MTKQIAAALRNAQSFLAFEPIEFDRERYSCCAILVSTGSTWGAGVAVCDHAVDALRDCGLDAGLGPLWRMTDMGLDDEQRQGARFMWLELLALEAEDAECANEAV